MSAGYNSRTVRTKADALDDNDPNTVQPSAADVLSLATLRRDDNSLPTIGFKAHLIFDTPLGNACDVQVFIRDESSADPLNPSWVDCGTVTGVVSGRAFTHDEVGDGAVYFRLLNISGGNPIEVRSEES